MRLSVVLTAVAAAVAVAAPAQAASVRSYALAGGGPHAIAASGDGRSVFVGARDCAYIGGFDIAARVATSHIAGPTSLGCAADAGVFSMVQGPDGKLYFTLYAAGQVGRVNADGSGLEKVPAGGTHPLDITVGPDGKIWYTVNGPPGKVGRLDPAAFAAPTTWNVPGNVQGPRGIISGPDGHLYVPGGESGKVWKVTTAATPAITEVATGLPGPSFGETGPDGKIWFTLFEGRGVRGIEPGGAGGQTIALPGEAWDVAFGQDGKAYATLTAAGQIAQVAPRGATVDVLPLSTGDSGPTFIASAPSGNLYVAGRRVNGLFEIVPDVPPRVSTGGADALTSSSATLGSSVNPRGAATSVRIVYGTTPAFGAAAETSLAAADDVQAIGIRVTGLAPQTTYHYRAEATNRFGTTLGETRTFTTPPAPDGDGDGVRPPADCDDASARVLPGAREIPDDGIDQDCSGADLRTVGSSIRTGWTYTARWTRVVTLTVRVPAGARIDIRCKGRRCPFKRSTRPVARVGRTVRLASLFKRRKLPVRTVIEVRVSAPGLVGEVRRYTVRRSRRPSVRTLCLAPGQATPGPCA